MMLAHVILLATSICSPAATDPLNSWNLTEIWPSVGEIRDIASDGANRLVALADNKIMFSENGVDWTNRTDNAVSSGRVVFGNGLFLIHYGSRIAVSDDGRIWQYRTLPEGSWSSVFFGNEQFVVCGAGGICISKDTSFWTKIQIPKIDSTQSAFFAHGQWHVFGGNMMLCSSSNFVNWTYAKTDRMGTVTMGNGQFVLNDRLSLYYSSNLTNWTSALYLPHAKVTFASKFFVAASDYAGGDQDGIWVSTDGINWVRRFKAVLNSVTFNRERFYATGRDSVYTSDWIPFKPNDFLAITNFAGVYLYGVIGRRYDIQATPSMEDTNSWKTVDSIILQTDPQLWIDRNTPRRARCFYRAVVQQ